MAVAVLGDRGKVVAMGVVQNEFNYVRYAYYISEAQPYQIIPLSWSQIGSSSAVGTTNKIADGNEILFKTPQGAVAGISFGIINTEQSYNALFTYVIDGNGQPNEDFFIHIKQLIIEF